jgi:hypothetical protein
LSTSGTTSFAVSRDDIIKRALRLVGAISQGQTPSTAVIDETNFALSCLVKALEADGMPIWAITSISIPVTAGVNSYTIGIGLTVNTSKPLKIFQAYNHDSNSNIDIPMRILTQQEYNRLGNKTTSGNPIQIYYQPLRDSGVLHVFPTPSSVEVGVNTIVIWYQRPYEDTGISTNNQDFPQEWYDVLCYGLAVRIAPEYGLPIEDRKALLQDYMMVKTDALGFGTEEGSLYFQSDQRDW